MANKGRHAEKSHKGLAIFFVIIFILAIIAVGAFVFKKQIIDTYNNLLGTTTTVATTTTEPTTVATEPTTTAPLDENTVKAQNMVAPMETKEKVCQLFVVTPEELTGVDVATVAGNTTKKKLTQYPVGGIVYFEQNKEDEEAFEEMVKKTKSYAKTPLFIMEDGDKILFTYSKELNVSDKLCDTKKSDGSEAVEAFNNGAEILMMPKNLSKAVTAMENAVNDGTIPQDVLNQAVTNVLKVKLDKGIIK